MAWQQYPVPCACGVVHQVPAGSAGSKFACQCGKAVEVPSLVRLKACAGQSAVSADFELDQMIGSNALPVEDTCGVCGQHTASELLVTVECEREQEQKPIAMQAALGCVFGWLGALVVLLAAREGRPGRTIGQNLRYHLPIRVCTICAGGKWTKELTRSVLERTPLYARLLAKYPVAAVGTPG